MLLEADLYAWSTHRISASQAALLDESLSLPGIGLVVDPVFVPSDDAVEGSGLLSVTWTRSKAGSYGDLVLLADTGLEPVQGISGTG